MAGETVPYGEWASPITPQAVVAAAASPGEVRVTPSAVFWHESRPEEGGRIQLVRKTDACGVGPAGPAARWLVGPYPGARVRRRRMVPHRGRRLVLQLGRSAHPPPAPRARRRRRRPGAGHARAGDQARPALRRPPGARQPARLRARAPRRRGGGRGRGQRDRVASRRRVGRARGAGHRPRLRRRPAHLARRHTAGVDPVGPPRHALGLHRAARRRLVRRRPQHRRAGGRRRRARRVGDPAAVASRRCPPLHLGPHRLVERLSAGRRRLGGGGDPARGRGRHAGLGLRHDPLRLPRRRSYRHRLRQRRARPPGHRRRRRCRGRRRHALHRARFAGHQEWPGRVRRRRLHAGGRGRRDHVR